MKKKSWILVSSIFLLKILMVGGTKTWLSNDILNSTLSKI